MRTGFFSLFDEVKKKLGNNIAIILCDEILRNSHCEEFVRVYINPGLRRLESRIGQIITELSQILFKKENLNILLSQNYTLTTIAQTLKRIRVRIELELKLELETGEN